MSEAEFRHAVLLALHTIQDKLQEIETLMQKETSDVIKAIDAATTAVATRLQKLIDLAATNGSATEAEIRAALQPEVDRLTAMGTDPTNPVPPA